MHVLHFSDNTYVLHNNTSIVAAQVIMHYASYKYVLLLIDLSNLG